MQIRGALLGLATMLVILAKLSAQRTSQLLVGFAAETDNLLVNAREKLKSKGLDLIVANDVTKPGAGFGSDQNAATLIDREGGVSEFPLMPKLKLAEHILDATRELLRFTPSHQTFSERKQRH